MLHIDLTVVQRVTQAFSGIREVVFVQSFYALPTTLPSESYSCHQRYRSLDNPQLTAKEMKEKSFFHKDQYSQREPCNSLGATFFFDSKSVLLF